MPENHLLSWPRRSRASILSSMTRGSSSARYRARISSAAGPSWARPAVGAPSSVTTTSVAPAGGRSRGRPVDPGAPFLEDRLQHVGPIGHDAVDAEVQQSVHLGGIVDRPHVHLEVAAVRGGQEPAGRDGPPYR